MIKPSYKLKVNWGHPISKGLIGCWLFNDSGGNIVVNLANQKQSQLTFYNGASRSIGQLGNCIKGATGTSNNCTAPFENSFSGNNKLTVLCSVIIDTNGNSSNRFFALDNSTANRVWALGRNASSDQFRLAIWKTGDVQVNCTGTSKYVVGKPVQVCGTYNQANLNLYCDGVSIATPVAETTALQTTSSPIGFTSAAYATSASLLGRLFYAYYWNRALTAGEIKQLYLDPYCFFQFPNNRARTNFLQGINNSNFFNFI